MAAAETVERIKGPYELIVSLRDDDVEAAVEQLRSLNGVTRVLVLFPSRSR